MKEMNSSQPNTRWHLSNPLLSHQLLLGSPRWYLTLACLLDTITPRILKVSLTFNFKSWLPPKEFCSYSELWRIPVFYTSRNRFAARKPLQSMVAGGMLVGSLFGAGLASSVLSGITADIADIEIFLNIKHSLITPCLIYSYYSWTGPAWEYEFVKAIVGKH